MKAEESPKAENPLKLEFQGYWLDGDGVPATSGVYSVYTYRADASLNRVTVLDLIHIGESRNVRERLRDPRLYAALQACARKGERLCFGFAPIQRDRKRAAAALIFMHKPRANTDFIDRFPFPCTSVITSGSNFRLLTGFGLLPTDPPEGAAGRGGAGTDHSDRAFAPLPLHRPGRRRESGRVGMTTDPDRWMRKWMGREGHRHFTILARGLTHEEALSRVIEEGDSRGCRFWAGGVYAAGRVWSVCYLWTSGSRT